MSKPRFAVQTCAKLTDEERQAWFVQRVEDLRQRGANHTRITVDSTDNPTILLVEGWVDFPDEWPAPKFLNHPAIEAARREGTHRG